MIPELTLHALNVLKIDYVRLEDPRHHVLHLCFVRGVANDHQMVIQRGTESIRIYLQLWSYVSSTVRNERHLCI
jgi:hypothetical protein